MTTEAVESELNPSNDKPFRVTEENRIPMDLPQMSMATVKIEGYELAWLVDRPGRILQAIRAGWEFVSPEEIQINNLSVSGDQGLSGSTDLGSRVSIHAGTDEFGKGMRQYLMKQREEWYNKDMALREERSERIAEALRAGRVGGEKGSPEDAARRYKRVDENLFTRKRR